MTPTVRNDDHAPLMSKKGRKRQLAMGAAAGLGVGAVLVLALLALMRDGPEAGTTAQAMPGAAAVATVAPAR
jgi:hypothetical protein